MKAKSLIVITLLAVLTPTPLTPPVHGRSAGGPATASVGASPVMFIENAGQFADGARFQVQGATSASVTVQQQAQNVELVGQIGGVTYAMAVQGTYSYIGVGPRLVILNVSDPSHPTVVGQTGVLPGGVVDVVVEGGYAYVADREGGLFILRFTGGEATHSISGRVVDGSGNLIPDVTISDNAGHTTTTGSDGRYTLSGRAAGAYTITPSKSGYTFSPASRTVTLPPDATGENFTGTLVPTTGKTPVVFVHGWRGFPLQIFGCTNQKYQPISLQEAKDYFQGLGDRLKADGGYSNSEIFYALLVSNPCYTPSLRDNVPHLMAAIDEAKAATGKRKVILIAHSMGGLVARTYIEGPNYRNDVESLFTFGSPHHGVPADVIPFLLNGLTLGSTCADYQPAVCDFTAPGMWLFNNNHRKNNNVIYHLADGFIDTLPLLSVGDGQYQAVYSVPDAPGYAEARLVATGATADGLSFERGTSPALQISPNTFTLADGYSDFRTDSGLNVTAYINATVNGTVGLSADLVNTSGNFVAHALTVEDVNAGAATLMLQFDGATIFASQRNRLYILTNGPAHRRARRLTGHAGSAGGLHDCIVSVCGLCLQPTLFAHGDAQSVAKDGRGGPAGEVGSARPRLDGKEVRTG